MDLVSCVHLTRVQCTCCPSFSNKKLLIFSLAQVHSTSRMWSSMLNRSIMVYCKRWHWLVREESTFLCLNGCFIEKNIYMAAGTTDTPITLGVSLQTGISMCPPSCYLPNQNLSSLLPSLTAPLKQTNKSTKSLFLYLFHKICWRIGNGMQYASYHVPITSTLVDVIILWPSSLLWENSHYSYVLLIYLISSFFPTTGGPIAEPSALTCFSFASKCHAASYTADFLFAC